MPVCLTMIVKNEARSIGRCLAFAKPHIDTFAIVDTGSEDDTVEAIEKSMQGIPGKVVRKEWKGFGGSRTDAFELARTTGADYSLVLDADEILNVPPGWKWPTGKDAYAFWMGIGAHRFRQLRLFSNRHVWSYMGVLHEFPTCKGPISEETMVAPAIIPGGGGARSADPKKYERDALVLENALNTTTPASPLYTRYCYYAAQSWRDAGKDQPAINRYLERATLGVGLHHEEPFIALLEAGKAMSRIGSPFDLVSSTLLRASAERPTRAEALHELAFLYRKRNNFHLAAMFARQASMLPLPPDSLLVDRSVYEWRAKDELAVASYHTGDFQTAYETNVAILKSRHLPEAHRPRITENLRHTVQRMTSRTGVTIP